MKRIAVILLIFCLLLCTACTPEPTVPDIPDEPPQTQDTPPVGDPVPEPTPEPDPQPEPIPDPEPVPEPAPDPEPDKYAFAEHLPVYLYSGETDVAVDPHGNVILEAEAGSLSLLRNGYTGEIVGIQQSLHEGKVVDQWGWAEAERSWCRLYDLKGNLLLEPEAAYVTVSGGLLSYYDEKTNFYTVLRLSDGSVVADKLYMAWLLDDVVVTKAWQWETPSTILDADGKVLWSQPEGWYISGYYQDGDDFWLAVTNPEGKVGLCDTRGNLLLECRYEQIDIVTGGRVILRDAGGWHVVDLATGETLLQWPYYIANVFENSAVVQSSDDYGRNILIDFDGNPLSDRVFQWLITVDDDFDGQPELLYGYLDYSQTTLPEGVSVMQQTTVFLQPDGTELFCVEYSNDQLEAINGDVILRRQGDWASEDVRYTLLRLSDGSETDLPQRQYFYAELLRYYSPVPQPEESHFFIANYENQLGHYRVSVIDDCGKVWLDDLKSCRYLGGGVFQVTQGFDTGLMDINGDWLYRQSRFSGLSD